MSVKTGIKNGMRYDLIPTANMSRDEWLRLRKNGIGGSDAGAICGLNPYTSAIGVFLNKTGKLEEKEDNEAMRQGRDLEEYVVQRFCEATGLKVRRSNMMYVNKEYPFMFADVDRLVIGEEAGLEAKTANVFQADKWKDGNIPAHYVIQCYHYMAVTGKRSWYIAVLIMGQGFQYMKLTWDDDIIGSLIQLEKEFWEKHVLTGSMPEPDGSKASSEVIAQYFKAAKTCEPVQLIGFDEKLKRRDELLKLEEKLEQERKSIEQEIQLQMAEHELAVTEGYRISWGNISTTRLDSKRLKAERPEIYREFAKESASRRFTVSAA